jgi:LPS-assembly lipoprotein
MTFADTQILAKDYEEQLLFRDMQVEAVQQILRRLSGAQVPKPRVP